MKELRQKDQTLMQQKSTLPRSSPLKNPLIVALDVDSDVQALKLAEQLEEFAGGFKVGPRLIQRYGSTLTQELAQLAPIFVDCKYFDIPSTMEASVQASFEAGASLVTVHAMAGGEALSNLAKLEKRLNAERPFRILCVTILTSWNEKSFPANFKQQSLADHVKSLAELAKASGLTGIVCSPEELPLLGGKDLYLVTPGIRLEKNSKIDDQKRTRTPAEAIRDGASALVVGRPIIAAADPKAAAREISRSLLI